MKKQLVLLLALFLFQHSAFAQDAHLIDSLKVKLNASNQDSVTTKILYELSKAYWGNNSDSAIRFGKQFLKLSQKIGLKKSIGDAYRNLGNIYAILSNYPEALNNYIASLRVFEQIRNKKGIQDSYIGIGIIYFYQGNYPYALKSYFQSLKINEEIGDKKGSAGILHNIGEIYGYQKKYPDALDFYFKAIAINKQSGNKIWLATNFNNVGEVYNKLNNYSDALKYYHSSLQLSEEISDKDGMANSYKNIGEVFKKEHKYIEALSYETIALALAKEIGSLDWMKEAYKNLFEIDSALNNFRSAYENHKLYMQLNDSMFNIERDKKLTSLQMQYDFDKKESQIKAAQEKKDVFTVKEMQKQKLVRNGFVGGFTVVLIFAGIFFTQRNKINKGKKRSDDLLRNILPEEVAEELKASGSSAAKQFDKVTVMFTDFKNFTQISEKLSPTELVTEIDSCFKAFDNIMVKNNIEKIKTIGDSYMCAGGLPVVNKTNATDVVNAAIEIRYFMQQHLEQRKKDGKEPFEIRIGIHSGAVVAGIVGVKKFAYDIWGDTVNIASRMESSGEAGKINISGSTYEIVKDNFNCAYRGKIQAKNKGEIDMYFVENSIY